MKPKQQKPAAFCVGDRVQFVLNKRTVAGLVVEDEGPLGVGGRRLYRVEVATDPYEPMIFTRPEEELEADVDYEERGKLLTKTRIMDYLKQIGLVGILRTNTPRGRNQPRVWLCLDTYNKPIYTFIPEHGLVGGATVPYWTMDENWKIFASKKEEVIAFLASFGLSRQEAEEVIEAVGVTRRAPAQALGR